MQISSAVDMGVGANLFAQDQGPTQAQLHGE